MSSKREFRVVDNAENEKQPYALLDETGSVILLSTSPRVLAKYAFDFLGAYSVKHDEDLLKAEGR